jgi:RNA polymerase sigma factor (sigma-70 family)
MSQDSFLNQLRRDEPAAWAKLKQDVERIASRVVHGQDQAFRNPNDLAQEALQRVGRRIRDPQFTPQRTLDAFIFGVVYKTWLELHRKGAKEKSNAPALAAQAGAAPGRSPVEAAETQDDLRHLDDCLRQLSRTDYHLYKCVALYWLCNLSQQEISEQVGITPANVAVRVHRGLEKLKQCMAGKYGLSVEDLTLLS